MRSGAEALAAVGGYLVGLLAGWLARGSWVKGRYRMRWRCSCGVRGACGGTAPRQVLEVFGIATTGHDGHEMDVRRSWR